MRLNLTQSRRAAKNLGGLKIWGYLVLIWLISLGATSCSILSFPRFSSSEPNSLIIDAPLLVDGNEIDISGQLLYDQPNGKLWSMSMADVGVVDDGGAQPLFRLPPGTFAFQPVWSAALEQIAYGYIAPDPETDKMMNARLWVANPDGTDARPVVQPPPDFEGTYRDPAWSPSGDALWATVQLPETDANGVTRFRSEIRRIDLLSNLATGSETVIIKNGRGPAISPSTQWIAYLAMNPQTSKNAIWRAANDGRKPIILVPGDQFEEIYVPMRFSPDGRYLAFAAADAANQLQRTPPASSSWLFDPFTTIDSLFGPATFGPAIAHAHGLYPADVWLVEIETGKLERLTQLSEDHPTPVWSADGRHLAFAGVLGIYVIDVAERSAVRITDEGVDGQIEWMK